MFSRPVRFPWMNFEGADPVSKGPNGKWMLSETHRVHQAPSRLGQKRPITDSGLQEGSLRQVGIRRPAYLVEDFGHDQGPGVNAAFAMDCCNPAGGARKNMLFKGRIPSRPHVPKHRKIQPGFRFVRSSTFRISKLCYSC